MEENSFFCRDENLNEFFATGKGDISHQSYWFSSGFLCNLIWIVTSDGNKHSLNFSPFLSFPGGVPVAAFVLQNNVTCLCTPWESLGCIESEEKVQ